MATIYRSIPELTEKDIKRFWSKVDKNPGHGPKGECWIWNSNRVKYGIFSVHGISLGPHRVAYYLGHCEDPVGYLVCHECDVMKCCNPAHLFKGTSLDNVRDAMSKNKMAHGDRHPNKVRPELRERLRKPHGRKGHTCGDNHHRHLHPEQAQGSRNGRATLTESQVQAIREDRKSGLSYNDLAKKHGTSRSIVAKIVTGKTWIHGLLPGWDVDGAAVR